MTTRPPRTPECTAPAGGVTTRRPRSAETGSAGLGSTAAALRLQQLVGNRAFSAAVIQRAPPTTTTTPSMASASTPPETPSVGPLPAPTTIPPGGEAVDKVGVINRDTAPEVRLRASPDTAADNIVRTLPFDCHVQVIKRFPGKWVFVSTPEGELGYVAEDYVWSHAPEPNARLHRVAGGVPGTAIAIAERYYRDVADDWGQDLRFYVNVLAWANKVPVPDTTSGWKQVTFNAGRLIWVPNTEFARSLKGVVNSGSLSYNIAEAVGLAGFIERVGELWDDFKTAFWLSGKYMGASILRHAGQSFTDALTSLAVMLVAAAGILAVSTAVGAAIGAIAGGGVGAAPGAAAGFEVGMVLLKWLGMAMMITWVAQSLVELGAAFGQFLATVWNARGDKKVLDLAAFQLAEAVGLLIGKLLEAAIMYAASAGLNLGIRSFKASKIGKSFGESKSGEWLTERVRKVQAGEAPIPGPREVIGYYRGVELVDAKKSPIGEFDGVDLARGRFVESKSVTGLERVNPRTGARAQTEAQWAEKQLTKKTTARINALKTAAGTRPTSGGSPTAPTLAQIQGIRKLHFRLDGNTPALRAAVHAELAKLRTAHPDWTFTVEFGVNITLPPMPHGERDDATVGP